MTHIHDFTPATPRPIGTEYTVFGSYGYVNEEHIYTGADYSEALDAYRSATQSPEDHLVIDLASFAESGEYLTHETWHANAP
jgi:hypothetical protein